MVNERRGNQLTKKIAPRKRGHGCGFLRDRYAGTLNRTVVFFPGLVAGVGAPVPLNSLLS